MKPEKIARLNKPEALQVLMRNAKERLRSDPDNQEAERVYWQAFSRLCSLEGMHMKDPLEREFYDVLNAYEQLLTEKNGRTTRASHTRQKLANKGVLQCLVDWASGPPTEGFKLLVERGLEELTAEHLVVKYAERFPDAVVEAAISRLGREPVARKGQEPIDVGMPKRPI